MSAASITPGSPTASGASARYRALGIVALVVALIGLVFSLVPPAAVIGWLLTPIGLILSIIALFLKGRKWPAVTALIVSLAGIVAGGVMLFAIAGVFS